MGLRINTNTSSLDALRNLHVSDRAQQLSLERLSSGLRINHGSDDPSGLVISERLRGQIAALKQDSENSQNATNLVSTADDALQKVSDLLTEIQRSVQFSLNTGGASADQISAEQNSVDQAVQAINRIAATTRYGDRSLLNGAAAYKLQATIPSSSGSVIFNDLNFKSVTFTPGAVSRTLALSFATADAPQRASVLIGANSNATTVIRISGNRGTADVTLASSVASAAVGSAINSVSDKTGVVYDSTNTAAKSADFGSDQFVSIQVVSGGLAVAALATPGNVGSDTGVDAVMSFEGQKFTAKGVHFSINAPDASFEFNLNPDLITVASANNLASATYNLSVENTGLQFQLREKVTASDRMAIGIDSMTASNLGMDKFTDVVASGQGAANSVIGGFLSSLMTGAGNDLTQNAGNALNIVNSASAKVATTRGFLGAAVAFNLQPNIDSIEVSTQNLSSSLSSLRDLDFAAETANFTRTQILFQSGIAALASARTIPQSVLQLLGR